MNIKEKIALGIIILIVIIPIVINEINIRTKLALINDVKEILVIINEYEYGKETKEIVIANEYEFDSKIYKVDGQGIIFLEENPSVMLSRDGMCAMKLPYKDEVMFQEEECPTYRLVNGEKVVVKE